MPFAYKCNYNITVPHHWKYQIVIFNDNNTAVRITEDLNGKFEYELITQRVIVNRLLNYCQNFKDSEKIQFKEKTYYDVFTDQPV